MLSLDLIKKIKSLSFQYGQSESWGGLHIFSSKDSSTELLSIQNQMIAFYHHLGLTNIDWKSYLSPNLEPGEFEMRMKQIFPKIDSLNMTLSATSRPSSDEVFLYKQSTPGWITVMSREFEWTLPGANPLALELSKNYDVLATTFIENTYTELTLYRNASVHSQILNGPSLDTNSSPSFDWSWFEGKGNVVPPSELSNEVNNLSYLLDLAGPDARGHRDSLSAAPIFDYGPDSYFIFRQQAL